MRLQSDSLAPALDLRRLCRAHRKDVTTCGTVKGDLELLPVCSSGVTGLCAQQSLVVARPEEPGIETPFQSDHGGSLVQRPVIDPSSDEPVRRLPPRFGQTVLCLVDRETSPARVRQQNRPRRSTQRFRQDASYREIGRLSLAGHEVFADLTQQLFDLSQGGSILGLRSDDKRSVRFRNIKARRIQQPPPHLHRLPCILPEQFLIAGARVTGHERIKLVLEFPFGQRAILRLCPFDRFRSAKPTDGNIEQSTGRCLLFFSGHHSEPSKLVLRYDSANHAGIGER